MRVLVVTGASGGHIFPALSLLDTLKDEDKPAQTLLVMPRSRLLKHINLEGYNIKYLYISGIKNLLVLLREALRSLFIVMEFRPDVVVGFGSIVSVPVVLCAWLFRIRTVIHEQNVIPGQANRFLAWFADRIAVSFPQTKGYLKGAADKTIITGNPLRSMLQPVSKKEGINYFGLAPDKFTLLVMGGSQASHNINMKIWEALSIAGHKQQLQVIHLCGEEDFAWLDKRYQEIGVEVKLFRFLNDMRYAYSASDLAVSRAGATSIAELIRFKVPAVIIPYPFAYEHQLNNAKVLEKRGCAVIIRDNELDTTILRLIIEESIGNPERIQRMRVSYDSFSVVDAAQRLRQAVAQV